MSGGQQFTWMDEAAWATVVRAIEAPLRILLKAAAITWFRPVLPGETVHVDAGVVAAGVSSARMRRRRPTERPVANTCARVAEATFVQVATDDAGQPEPLRWLSEPPGLPRSAPALTSSRAREGRLGPRRQSASHRKQPIV
jgi:acyl-CoA hydrolase